MYLNRRDKKENLYTRLQEQSLEWLQQLSGEVWTDFNPHDPGVTISELLNYALLELNYRQEFPIQDYLLRGDSGKIPFERYGLLPPEEIFAQAVITPQDYEELILDNIPEITCCRVDLDKNQLYRITVDIRKNTEPEAVLNQVRELYHAHRNLGENLGEIVVEKLHPESKEVLFRHPQFSPETGEAIPVRRNLTEYRSVQLDFPDNYGIGSQGLPAGASEERIARARQLKAYLLIFDYLMARTLGQMKNIPQQFELSGQLPRIKIPQIRINDIGHLINRERLTQSRVEDPEFRHLQKSYYLDMLDSLYGEDTRHGAVPASRESLPMRNRKRAFLIRQFPRLNTERFRAVNLLGHEPDSVCGIKKLVAAIMGIDINQEIPLTNLFSRYNVRLVHDEFFFRGYRTLLNIEFVFENIEDNPRLGKAEEVPERKTDLRPRRIIDLRKRLNLFSYNVIFESFLIYGAYPEYYRIVPLEQESGYLLVFKHPEMKKWINMGFFTSRNQLIETANVLWLFLKKLTEESCLFYVVEHILLQANPEEAENTGKLSVILPRWSECYFVKNQYEELIRERLPAHLEAEFLWFHADQVYAFEKIYFGWRKALAGRDAEQAERLAKELSGFLRYQASIL